MNRGITSPIIGVCLLLSITASPGNEFGIYPGADEKTPSRAQYFSWINNTNEGSTEEHTLINLGFFQWMQEEYGMNLDIYAFDAGVIDGPGFYGKVGSEAFLKQFPNGFDPIYEKAKAMDTRLGHWGGPDGFGDTPQEAQERIEMMAGLCRDYDWALFKLDSVCGELRKEKEPYFIKMMEESRKHSPDLIALNHRLPLSPEGEAHMTTSLLGGRETYIDVHMRNTTTGTHHRVGAISRGLTPGLTRLSEDHGVCISSCPDFWDDDLILQAFNRCLILAPEIYGNPWFLRDDEFPKLARIYNLHRRYRDILVNGMTLPASYGPDAVSRGDGTTRFLTLRNLTWEPVTYSVKLDAEIGLQPAKKIELRQFHPTEKVIGSYPLSASVEIVVPPFQACLLMASSEDCPEIAVKGCDYEVIRDTTDKPIKINLLGMPGTTANVSLHGNSTDFSSATIEAAPVDHLLRGEDVEVTFPGAALKHPYHRKLANLQPIGMPSDAEVLYETTVFSADNNALELRAIERSGETTIPAVKSARDAFFNQPLFTERGVSDRFMFDGDATTTFFPSNRYGDISQHGGALRVDFGEAISPDKIEIFVPDSASLQTWIKEKGDSASAEISHDLKSWEKVTLTCGDTAILNVPAGTEFRYLRIPAFSPEVSEINASKGEELIGRDRWRASNLFAPYAKMGFEKAWSASVKLEEAATGSYLCVAINGAHGNEGAYVGIRTQSGHIGAPDRAPSYAANQWEFGKFITPENYTYFIPVSEELLGEVFEVFILGTKTCSPDLKPELWITTGKLPLAGKELIIRRATPTSD
ncbi:MAG: hypothetical protein ABJQ29_01690 [Luteolibacter sp.]